MRLDRGRALHMHGVAEYMYEHAPEYELDPDEMYLLGWLHDIGYIYGKEEHEGKGAALMSDARYARFIEAHGLTPQEYADCNGIMSFEIPKEMLLLWEADMMIDLTGEVVGFEKRLSGIREKYGEDSVPYQICDETMRFLANRKAMERQAETD